MINTKEKVAIWRPSLSLSINILHTISSSFTQGELEGAKPASNQIKCRAKPCLARRAWSEATIFVPQGGTKITALFQAVEKSRRLFRQPERRSPYGDLLFLYYCLMLSFPLGRQVYYGYNPVSQSFRTWPLQPVLAQ